MYGQFQDGAEYSFAESGVFLSSNEYMLITHNYSSQCLLAFLNSRPIEWLLSNITGSLGTNAKIGQKSNFLKLSIPYLAGKEQSLFEGLVNQILTQKRKNEDTTTIERKIDILIYKLFNLTELEIREIECSYIDEIKEISSSDKP